ncbi:hypothetical protein BpHYR1_029572 [Brachionus plicatilis]|uniref:Uncharacterized protein n=1 Tax=Brachionus plicatilis TaxID=10195 RepID=A0A3M7PZB7_BRAPC|nr:hypothetical protein BpHYR1_029572 [Brachionus plicatilis]
MRHLYQNFDINCSIFSRSVSGKKSGLNVALKSRILKINAALGGKALRLKSEIQAIFKDNYGQEHIIGFNRFLIFK